MSQEEIVVPKGWELKTIEEICNKITDGEHLKPKTVSEGVPFVSAKDLKDNGVDFNHVLYVDKMDAEIFRKKCNPEKNDILIGSRGSIGKICLVNTEQIFCLLGSVILLKPLLSIESKFILYYFKSGQAQNQLLNASGHSVVKALYLRDIKKLKILVPEKQIQKQIVAKLDHILGELEVKKKEILSLIEQNKERIDFFEKNWFSYIVNTEIKPILLNCQQNKEDFYFEDLINCCTDVIDTPHSTVPYQESGIPVIRTSNIKPYKINFSNCKYTSKKTFEERRKKLDPKIGDILYAREAPWGISAQVKKEGFVVGQRLLLLRPNLEKINSDFLDLILNSSFGYNQAKSVVNETTSGHVNIGDIKKFKIPVIPENEQAKIVKNIKSAEEKFQSQKKQFENIKQNYDSKINYINHIQSSILDSAFSGKLVQ